MDKNADVNFVSVCGLPNFSQVLRGLLITCC